MSDWDFSEWGEPDPDYLNEISQIRPWSRGQNGKGLINADGQLITWATNEYGDPHHDDVAQEKPFPYSAKVDIFPNGNAAIGSPDAENLFGMERDEAEQHLAREAPKHGLRVVPGYFGKTALQTPGLFGEDETIDPILTPSEQHEQAVRTEAGVQSPEALRVVAFSQLPAQGPIGGVQDVLHQPNSLARTADKLNGFLRNPKSRPDLQTPEAQEFLNHLEKYYHNEKTDALMPWLTREWKKGRVQYIPSDLQGNLLYDRNGVNNGITPGTVTHWADWLNSPHSKQWLAERYGAPDIMKHTVQQMPPAMQDWDRWRQEQAALHEAEKNKKLGEVVHQFPDGWTVRRLPPEALEYEGNQMGHCVGDYGGEVRDGRSLIYSLRDENHEPHATVELKPTKRDLDIDRALSDDMTWRHIPERLKQSLRDYHEGRPMTYNDYPPEEVARTYHELAKRGPFTSHPEKAIIEQIQGKGNEVPKPEYQQRLKEWFETFPEEDRPNWYNRPGSIDNVSQIAPETFDEEYDDEDQGGYGPHGDYGLLPPPPEAHDYQGLINSTWDPPGGYGRASWDEQYDPDKMKALYQYARANGHIPHLAEGAQQAAEDFYDKFDENYFPEYIFNPDSGERMVPHWYFDGVTSSPADPQKREEFMDELEKHGMETWDPHWDSDGRSEVSDEQLQELYQQYEEAYLKAEQADRDYAMREWPQGQAINDVFGYLAPHWNGSQYVNDPKGGSGQSEVFSRTGYQGRTNKTNVKIADHPSGYTNWHTWNTGLMMDNEEPLYRKVRQLVQNGATPERLRDWAVRNVIGPYNRERIQEAQDWNSIPRDERLDHHYEDLKDKSPEAADLVNNLGFGPDIEDVEPDLIDPELVNWYELHQNLKDELDENDQYEREKDRLQQAGLSPDWTTPGHDDAIQHMREAMYRYHGALPDEEMKPEYGGGYTGNDPRSVYRRVVTIPYDEHVNSHRFDPENHMSLETRNAMRDVLNQRQIERLRQEHADNPHVNDQEYWTDPWYPKAPPYSFLEYQWYRRTPREVRDKLTQYDINDPEQQAILNADPNWQQFAQNGYQQGLHEYTWDVINDLHRGQATPRQTQEMQQALTARGYSPEQIAEMMQQRRQWDPTSENWIDLRPKPPAPPDPSLDQPGDFTLPSEWTASVTSTIRQCQSCGDPLNEDGECSRCDWLDRGWEGWVTNQPGVSPGADPTKDMKGPYQARTLFTKAIPPSRWQWPVHEA